MLRKVNLSTVFDSIFDYLFRKCIYNQKIVQGQNDVSPAQNTFMLYINLIISNAFYTVSHMHFLIECCIGQEVRKSFPAEAVRVKVKTVYTHTWNLTR